MLRFALRFSAFMVALGIALAAPAPAARDTLRIGFLRDIDTINPLLSGQAATTDLAQFVFSGLFRYDNRGELQPDVATAVPSRANGGISPDGKTLTYHLRHDVRFSDGAALTADDVVFTWQQIMNPANNVAYHFPHDQARSVVAKDKWTVAVSLKEPSAPFIAEWMRDGIQGAIMPRHLLVGNHDLNRIPYNSKPIGSGPYVIDSYAPGSGLTLSANPLYFRGEAKIKHIRYEIIPNENSLMTSLRTHEIDFYWGAPEQQYASLKALDGISVDATPSQQFEHVAFNTKRAPFDDVRVRQAAAYAIDWHALVTNVYLNVDLPGMTDIFPKSWAFDATIKPYPHDLTRARALLDAAGWKVGNDGIRARDGKRLTVDISTVNGVTTRNNAEVLIQQNCKDVGIEVQVRNYPANLLFSAYGAGGILARGNFDLAIYAWVKTPDPDNIPTLGPESVAPHGANYSGFADAQIGKWQHLGAQSYERDERKKWYLLVQRREYEMVPIHTIVWRANINAYVTGLHGFNPGAAFSDFWNIADWTLD